MEPSIELVAVLLGIMKSGRAYVPIHPGLPRARVQSMVRTCGGLTVLGTVADDWTDIPGLRHHSLRPVSRPASPVAGPRPDDTAYVIFTSGTTGEPKGVPITHAAVTSMLSSVADAMPVRGMRWSLYHSFAFDASVWEIFGALLFDGVLCIPTREERADPGKMAEFLRRADVGMLSQTPSAFEVLGPRIEASEYSPETVVFFGERLNFAALKDFAARHPRTRLVNMYGITETTVHAAFYQLPRQIDRWPANSADRRAAVRHVDHGGRPGPAGAAARLPGRARRRRRRCHVGVSEPGRSHPGPHNRDRGAAHVPHRRSWCDDTVR